MNIGNLTITTLGDREIQATRVFDAPRDLLFEALTRPELIRRWLSGPPGWSMTHCEFDLRVGGAYRYEWKGPGGIAMGMGGVIQEIAAPERIVASERYDEAWYPGEALDTMHLAERAGKTTLTITVRYDSRDIRDAVLKTPMAAGMAAGYDRLAELLASLPGGGA